MEIINKIKYPIMYGLIGFALCYFSIKQKTKIKTEIKEKVKTKIVTIEVEKKQEKRNTYKEIIKKPDGETRTIIREIVENSTENVNKTNNKTKTVKQESRLEIKRTSSLGVIMSLDKNRPYYNDFGIIYKYTIYDPVSIQSVYMIKNKNFLIGVAIDF